VEVRVTPMRTEIIIRATRTQNVLGARARRRRRMRHVHAGVCVAAGVCPKPWARPPPRRLTRSPPVCASPGEKGRRIRELTSVVQKRFKFPEGSVELYAEKVANRGLCAIAQAESLRYKLLGGLAVRRCAPCGVAGAGRTAAALHARALACRVCR
jgi:small subunit ribosomal protein S3e